jgi:gas vesicle protein
LPLKSRTAALEDTATDMGREIKSITNSLTNAIDANQDVVRQLGDVDEKVQEIEDSISNRMNTIRDTLMEMFVLYFILITNFILCP